MSRIINIQHVHNYQVQLNYLPYRYRGRSYSSRKLIIDQFQYCRQSPGYSEIVAHHRYVRTFSPPNKKTQKDIFQKYSKPPKHPLQNRKEYCKEQGYQQYAEKLQLMKGKVEMLNKFDHNGKKGQRLYTFNQNYHETIPLQKLQEEQSNHLFNKIHRDIKGEEQQVNNYGDAKGNQVGFGDVKIQANEDQSQYLPLNIQQHQKSQNKLEDTTKSYLKSDFSIEDHKHIKQSKQLQYLIKNDYKQKLQQIYQHSHQNGEVSSQSKQQHNKSYEEQLQYSQRSHSKKDSSSSIKKDRDVVYTKLSHFIKNSKQNSQEIGSMKSKEELNSKDKSIVCQSKLNDEYWDEIRQNFNQQYQVNLDNSDPNQISQEELENYSEHYEGSQHQSQDYHFIDEDQPLFPQNNSNQNKVQNSSSDQQYSSINKNSYKSKYISSRKKSSHSSGSPVKKKIEEVIEVEVGNEGYKKSRHPSIFLKNKQNYLSEGHGFHVSKIPQLSDLMTYQQQIQKNFYEQQKESQKDELHQKYQQRKPSQKQLNKSQNNHPKIFTQKQSQNDQKNNQLELNNSRRQSYTKKDLKRQNVYGKKYVSKQKQMQEQKKPSPKKNKKNKVNAEKYVQSDVVVSVSQVNQFKQNSQQKHFPQTQKEKSKQIQHIWSFSDLPSEELRKIQNRPQNSNAFADYSSPYQLSSILPDQHSYNHPNFKKQQYKISESFPNYLNNGHNYESQEVNGSKTVPLDHCSQKNSLEIKHSTVKLKNVAKSLQGENILDLIGQSDHMKELSSLAMESKDEGAWNQNHLKQQLSRFLIDNKILNQEDALNSQSQNKDSTFKEEIANSFHLDEELKEEMKYSDNYVQERERKIETLSYQNQKSKQIEQIVRIRQVSSLQNKNNQITQRELESYWIQRQSDFDPKQQRESQAFSRQSSFIPSSQTGNIYDFKNHFSPRKQAIKRFDKSKKKNTNKIPIKSNQIQQYDFEGYTREADSISPSKNIVLELGEIQRNRRLDKNLSRFKTRVRYDWQDKKQ